MATASPCPLAAVLRTLPPDVVRQHLWLPLPYSDRAALRATCRELRTVLCSRCVLDLHVRVRARTGGGRGLPLDGGSGGWGGHRDPWQTAATASATIAGAAAAAAGGAGVDGMEGQRGCAARGREALHDVFAGPRTVTYHCELQQQQRQQMACGEQGQEGPPPATAASRRCMTGASDSDAAAAETGGARAGIVAAELEAVRGHLSAFGVGLGREQAPRAGGSAGCAGAVDWSRDRGHAPAGGWQQGADGSTGAGEQQQLSAPPVLEQLFAPPYQPCIDAAPSEATQDTTTSSSAKTSSSSGGLHLGGLGVCRTVRQVRILGLPYSHLTAGVTASLAAAYPELQSLEVDCLPLPAVQAQPVGTVPRANPYGPAIPCAPTPGMDQSLGRQSGAQAPSDSWATAGLQGACGHVPAAAGGEWGATGNAWAPMGPGPHPGTTSTGVGVQGDLTASGLWHGAVSNSRHNGSGLALPLGAGAAAAPPGHVAVPPLRSLPWGDPTWQAVAPPPAQQQQQPRAGGGFAQERTQASCDAQHALRTSQADAAQVAEDVIGPSVHSNVGPETPCLRPVPHHLPSMPQSAAPTGPCGQALAADSSPLLPLAALHSLRTLLIGVRHDRRAVACALAALRPAGVTGRHAAAAAAAAAAETTATRAVAACLTLPCLWTPSHLSSSISSSSSSCPATHPSVDTTPAARWPSPPATATPSSLIPSHQTPGPDSFALAPAPPPPAISLLSNLAALRLGPVAVAAVPLAWGALGRLAGLTELQLRWAPLPGELLGAGGAGEGEEEVEDEGEQQEGEEEGGVGFGGDVELEALLGVDRRGAGHGGVGAGAGGQRQRRHALPMIREEADHGSMDKMRGSADGSGAGAPAGRAGDGAHMVGLPAALAALTRLQLLSVDAVAGPCWLQAAARAARRLHAYTDSCTKRNVPAAAEAEAGGAAGGTAVRAQGRAGAGDRGRGRRDVEEQEREQGGTAKQGGGGGREQGSVRREAVSLWAGAVAGCGASLRSLSLHQELLDQRLLQALSGCSQLTHLAALGLAPGLKVRATGCARDGGRPPPLESLRSLRLSDVQLGRQLVTLISGMHKLSCVELGLRMDQQHVAGARAACRVGAAGETGAAGLAAAGEGPAGQLLSWAEDAGQAAAHGLGSATAASASDTATSAEPRDAAWRAEFGAAKGDGEQLVVAGGGGGRNERSSSPGREGPGGRGVPAQATLLPGAPPLCGLLARLATCRHVALGVYGAVAWVELVGVLAGALGRRLGGLALQASSWQWQVRDDALAAVAYGLPYLRSLALLSYDVQREGLMRLADMAELREVRFEMDDFLAWLPPQHVADMAEAAARARARPATRSVGPQGPAPTEAAAAAAAAAAAGAPEAVEAAVAMAGRTVAPQLPLSLEEEAVGGGRVLGVAAPSEATAVAAGAAQGMDRGTGVGSLTIMASFLSHGQADAINRQLEGQGLGAWVSVAVEGQGGRWDCLEAVLGVEVAAAHA